MGGSLELKSDRGTLALNAPKGALKADTEISARPIRPPLGAVGAAFELLPHGTRFNKPVELAFERPPADLFPPHRLRVATQTLSCAPVNERSISTEFA